MDRIERIQKFMNDSNTKMLTVQLFKDLNIFLQDSINDHRYKLDVRNYTNTSGIFKFQNIKYYMYLKSKNNWQVEKA